MCWLNKESSTHSSLEDAFRRRNWIEEASFWSRWWIQNPWSLSKVEVEVYLGASLSTKSLIFRDDHKTLIFGQFSTRKVILGKFKLEEDCWCIYNPRTDIYLHTLHIRIFIKYLDWSIFGLCLHKYYVLGTVYGLAW